MLHSITAYKRPSYTAVKRLLLIAMLITITGTANAAIIGVSRIGNLYSISETTAVATLIGPTQPLGGLDYSSDGTLYGFTFGNSPALYTVDDSSGTATLVGSLGFNFIFEGGLAIGPGDRAYGVNYGDSSQPGLFSVDLTTGAATEIGIMSGGNHDINGLEVRSDGMLVGLDRVTSSLLLIDPTTAATSVIASVGFTVDIAGGMTGDGVTGFFADGSNLYSFDMYSGAVTSVGNMGYEIYGLASTPVPIPAAAWLFGSGLALIGWIRSKKTY